MSPEISQLVAAALPSAPDPTAVVVDFETYYDEECSVKTYGNWAYCRHPKWDCYLVSIYSHDVQFVGHPKDAPWDKINGRRWLSHNRGFDRTVFERLAELRVVDPSIRYSDWHDTADLAAWSHLPRNLAGALAYGLNLRVSKQTRNDMKGKNWAEMTPEFKREVIEYAGTDGVGPWLLWQKFSPSWPADERELSVHTGEIEFRGIPTDRAALEHYVRLLRTAKHVVEKSIPWLTEENEKTGENFKMTSPDAIKRACLLADVPVPSTTSIKKQAFLDWLDEFGDAVPALREIASWRKINRALNLFESWAERIRPDGRAAIGLMYFGAQKTGRWSGTSGVSLHNLAKLPILLDPEFRWLEPVQERGKVTGGKRSDGVVFALKDCHVIDSRGVIKGRLGIADLSQIEPRCTNWIVGNKAFLDYCKSGMSPYEAHARACMGWTGGVLKKEAPGIYALAKARVLALGYGAGWHKFITMASQYVTPEEFEQIFNVEVTPEQEEEFLKYLAFCASKNIGGGKAKLKLFEEIDRRERNIWVNSWLIVCNFRDDNPLIANKDDGLWATLDAAFKASVKDGVYENELPSGRSLKYFDVTSSGGWTAKQGNPGAYKVTRCYGGLLTENLIQGVARDAFAYCIIQLERAGYRVLFHVHDEVIVELTGDQTIDGVLEILHQTPPWASGLPVAAEGEESDRYKK